ncbi:YlxR family protein [Actinorugispora endophytica]|uniref:YlxR family protein n=1 Tax=Actinorugispora endophytica TaxID=1605990 RepID=UPI00105E5559|nr:YlxR family protein [Actinorugispora endophytica]
MTQRRARLRGVGPSAPVRTCVGCRSRAVQSDLVRLVLDGGAIVCDTARRLPGRGAYLHPDQQCWESAQRRRVWRRAFRTERGIDASGAAARFIAA